MPLHGCPPPLDLCWQTLAECFEPEELLMKQHLVDKYYPPAKQRAEEAALSMHQESDQRVGG